MEHGFVKLSSAAVSGKRFASKGPFGLASDLVAIVTNLAFANFFLKRQNQSTGWQLQVLMTSASEEERTCLAGN